MEVLGAVLIGIVACVAFVLWVQLDRAQRALYGPIGPNDEPPRALSEPEQRRARVVVAPLPGASYPTLRMLDRARQDGGAPFADAPGAAWLEQCARELIDASWGELVWRTGLVPAGQLEAVCDALERERQAQEASVRIIVGPVIAAGDASTPAS